MTTEEKLKRFRELCIEDEKNRTKRVLEEYREGLSANFEEHKKHALRRQEEEFSIEKEKADREIRSSISERQQLLKVKAGKRAEELKEKIFSVVEEMLGEFRGTSEYRELIKKELKDIEAKASGEAYEVYLDCSESEDIKSFAKSLLPEGAKAGESQRSFLGGTMAIIGSQNILIDNSFLTKLLKEKNEFSF